MDNARIAALEGKLSAALKEHYSTGEGNEESIFEALNAFGVIVAMILGGTGNDQVCREFFFAVLVQQLEIAMRMAADMNMQDGLGTRQ